MITAIIKRDGRQAPFNLEKISDAILKSLRASGVGDADQALHLAARVAEFADGQAFSRGCPSVEEIQDIVERVLIDADLADAAKRYILYRAERTRAREMNTRLMRTYEEITARSSAESDMKRDNANIDGDTAMGAMLKYGSEGAKIFNEMYILKPEHAQAHTSGDIHIHDFDFYTLTTTCCQIDVQKLFQGGFSTGHGFLREPNSISSYAALACIAIQSNQNDQHGGQSIPNFDYAMADGVRKTYAKRYFRNLIHALEIVTGETPNRVSAAVGALRSALSTDGLSPSMSFDETYTRREADLLGAYYPLDVVKRCRLFARRHVDEETRAETYQAMEALIHNLNTMHSRAGAQVPFSSINYGTDTTPEGRLVVENLLLATEAGLGFGETPIFPIQIFKVKEGVNYSEGDPNYDLLKLSFRVSAKRLFPNYAFLDSPFNIKYYKAGKPETEAAYMGCRTRVVSNIYDPEREVVSGRGNLSFTSINLPRCAILAEGSVERFLNRLDGMLDLCIEQLLERFAIQCRKKARNFPFMMGNGIWLDSDALKPDDEIGEVLRHGTLTIGFIGLAEALKALIGGHHGETEEARSLGLKIIGGMRARADEEARRRKLNFSLLATPAEGLSGRFVKMDRKRFGVIEGVTDRDYYTNSFHIPVYYQISAYRKIAIEAPYHELTNGGHITYVELDGDPSENLAAFEAVIRAMKEHGVGYGSINHPLDRDPVCRYTGIIGDTCPKCGRREDEGPKFERIRRITGYLVGALDRFNDAKLAEESDRVRHSIGGEYERELEII
ncbi:MAG: anaerobic ribonucleoside triphosphate reductase [Clostridiales bacterium]|jgi:ribonucleoside-triphosphate reductase|nr:anaerobic ribonucleoside triphosphate reductase [Clostridiales bacterium]